MGQAVATEAARLASVQQQILAELLPARADNAGEARNLRAIDVRRVRDVARGHAARPQIALDDVVAPAPATVVIGPSPLELVRLNGVIAQRETTIRDLRTTVNRYNDRLRELRTTKK